MKIMAVECSATPCSVAVIEDGRVLASGFVNVKLTHSQTLMPMVESMLKASLTNIADIDGFCVSSGPGSFTGVRIGISAVKGMAAAGKKPCVGVSTLRAMAENYSDTDCIVCAVMDARCNQVYTAIFNNGERLCDDKAVLIDELGEELKQYDKKIVFIGDGSVLCYDKLHEIIQDCDVADEKIRYVHGESIGFVAENKIKNGEEPINSANLVPFYLRLPQAERELNNKNSLKK